MSDQREPANGPPEYYRARAENMLIKAETSKSEADRASYLKLAIHWQQLADKFENPNW
jgi:hypothetical protein